MDRMHGPWMFQFDNAIEAVQMSSGLTNEASKRSAPSLRSQDGGRGKSNSSANFSAAALQS